MDQYAGIPVYITHYYAKVAVSLSPSAITGFCGALKGNRGRIAYSPAGCYPIQTIGASPHHPRIFMLVALAATLPIYSASRQAPNNAVLCTWLLGFVDYVQCIVYWWNDGFLYLLPVPFVLYEDWLMALSPGHACVISILLWCKYFHMHYNMVRHALHICFTSEISVSVSYFASQIQTLAYCSDDRQWLKLPLAHYMVIGDAAIICHSGFVIPFSIS